MVRQRKLVIAALVALCTAALVVVSPASEAAPRRPSITERVAIAPPDATAVDFGAALSIHVDRVIASARIGGRPLVYVFERSSGTWNHSATIRPGSGASNRWGEQLAISGRTVAIADPGVAVGGSERYGKVHIYDLVQSTWTLRQTLTGSVDHRTLGPGVWLSGRALVVAEVGECDGHCDFGRWLLFTRGETSFTPIFDSSPRAARPLSVGVHAGTFVVGNTGVDDPFGENQPRDNSLMVWDTSTTPPAVPHAETTPYRDGPFGPIVHDGWYRRVDISLGTFAVENCCTPEHEVRIYTGNRGAGFSRAATLPVGAPSDWLSLVPGVVLLADRSRGGWRTFVQDQNGDWEAGADLSAPDDAARSFATQPIASGPDLAVRGDNVVWVLTISPAPK